MAYLGREGPRWLRAGVSARFLQAAVAVAVAGLACWATIRVAQQAWLCDDSFISFRYAANLVRGEGLVWNPGERVEGYTNLSWTLLMALALAVGWPPEAAAQVLGYAFYVLLVVALLAASRRRHKAVTVPLAAILVLALDDFHVWATGGLETSMFAALSVLGLLLALGDRLVHAALAGLVLGLAVMTRPDGMIFAVAGGVWMLAGARRGARTAAYALPLGVLLAGLAAFKLAYYGELLPTAFYAKSAATAYFSQGVRYVALFLAKNWCLLPLGIFLHQLSLRRPDLRRPETVREAWLFGGAGLAFVLYVVYSGGDYMFARRLVPALPLLFLAGECVAERLDGKRRAALALLAAAAASLSYPVFRDGVDRVAGISDERRFYPAAALAARREQAAAVGAALRGTSARVMIAGGLCSFAYYSDLPYVVEMTGLTQYSLARRPLERRGIVGHEKTPDRRWIEEQEIHLFVDQLYPAAVRGYEPRADEIVFRDLAVARVLVRNEALLDTLKDRPGVKMGREGGSG